MRLHIESSLLRHVIMVRAPDVKHADGQKLRYATFLYTVNPVPVRLTPIQFFEPDFERLSSGDKASGRLESDPPMKSNRCALPCFGFTLIELLVVIAIIGILSALLLPALSSAKGRGKQAACISNLRQLGVATQLYQNEYEVFPPHKWSIGNGQSDRWPVAVASQLRSEQFLICPSVPQWKIGRNNSYGYNYKYLGSLRSNSESPTAPYERFPVKQVASPSTTITYADSDGTGNTDPYEAQGENVNSLGNHGYTLDPTYIPKSSLASVNNDGRPEAYSFLNYRPYISTRHQEGSNASWVDGHVEKVLPKDVYQDNRFWNGYGAENPADVHVDTRSEGAPFRFSGLVR